MKKVQEIRDRIKQKRSKHAQKVKKKENMAEQSHDESDSMEDDNESVSQPLLEVSLVDSKSVKTSQTAKDAAKMSNFEDQDERAVSHDSDNGSVGASDDDTDVICERKTASSSKTKKRRKCPEKLDCKSHDQADGTPRHSSSPETVNEKSKAERDIDQKTPLEKEINKLERMPKITIKLQRLCGEIVSSDTSIQDEAKPLTGRKESSIKIANNGNCKDAKGQTSVNYCCIKLLLWTIIDSVRQNT
jgi:hypothetical protein